MWFLQIAVEEVLVVLQCIVKDELYMEGLLLLRCVDEFVLLLYFI
jgi:hypothetical protein